MSRLLAVLFAILALASPAAAIEPMRVVVSFPILADITARVGGEHVAVSSLVPPGAEPHGWSPSPQDVRRVAEADVIIVNGLGLEGWLDRLIEASGYDGPVVVASRDVKPILDSSGTPDPHAWHRPANAARYASVISEYLTRQSSGHAPVFEAGLKSFLTDLHDLEGWTQSRIATVPPERRVVVTTHDAFAYLGQELGARILSPAGLDSAAQPSAKRMAALVAKIRIAGVKAVFPEDGADDRLARTLADEAGVALGAPLYAGTLSAPDGPAPDYITMWRYNVTQMLQAMSPK